MGVLPEPGAHLLRAAVLLRQDRLDEARRELSEELAADTGARADRPFEAASIRGLLRVARQKGEPESALLAQRLAVLERQFQDGAAKNPHVATAVAGAYLWTDPDAAADWLGRGGAPGSFAEAFHRALAYRMAGRHAEARASLETRAPSERCGSRRARRGCGRSSPPDRGGARGQAPEPASGAIADGRAQRLRRARGRVQGRDVLLARGRLVARALLGFVLITGPRAVSALGPIRGLAGAVRAGRDTRGRGQHREDAGEEERRQTERLQGMMRHDRTSPSSSRRAAVAGISAGDPLAAGLPFMSS